MMRLTGLLIIGLSMTALADMVNAGERFDSEVRRVDVMGQIHHQVSQVQQQGCGIREASRCHWEDQ